MREDAPTLLACPRCEAPGEARPRLAGFWCDPCSLVYSGSTAEWAAYHPDAFAERRRQVAAEARRQAARTGAAAARAALHAGRP